MMRAFMRGCPIVLPAWVDELAACAALCKPWPPEAQYAHSTS